MISIVPILVKTIVNDIKRRDEDVSSLEDTNNEETLLEDIGCPTEPNEQEEEPNYFRKLGGYPAPEPDDWDEEPSDKRKKNFFARLLQTYGCLGKFEDDFY